MLLGEIFQAMESWKKLSAVPMKPSLGYRLLKYTKLVSAEYEVAEKQRVELIREISGTKEGQDAKIEPDTPEFKEYVKRFQEVLTVETALKQVDVKFDRVMKAVGEIDGVLTVTDLATLEPFFKDEDSDKKD